MQHFSALVTLPVQWGEMDSYGHVNNTVYLKCGILHANHHHVRPRYTEAARIAWLEQVLGDAGRNGIVDGLGPILAHMSIAWKAPLTFPDEILVGARATELGADYIIIHQGTCLPGQHGVTPRSHLQRWTGPNRRRARRQDCLLRLQGRQAGADGAIGCAR